MKTSSRIVPVTLGLATALFMIGCEQADTSNAQVKAVSQQTPAAEATKADPAAAAELATKAEQLVPAVEALRPDGTATPPAYTGPVSTVQIVKADPAIIDLGEIPTLDSKAGKVKLVNTGDTPMTVVSARPSCGCTAMKFTPNTVIPPMESIEVDVQMTGPAQPGDVSGKMITFIVEGQPDVVVQLKGKAVSFVAVEPTTLDPETMPEGKFTLKSVDGQPFRVMSVQPQVIDNIEKEAKPEHTLTVSWEKYREIGINRQMVVYLDHPKCQSVQVKVGFKPEELAAANKRLHEQQGINKQAINDKRNQVDRSGVQPAQDPDAVLAAMIREGRNSEVMAKLQSGLDVNYRDGMGTPLIGVAAKAGNADLVKALLATNKVDINSTDNQGRTPLMHAATSKNADTVYALLDAGASATTRDALGATALWWAGMQGSGATVQALLDAGADVEIVGTITGWTPLIVAAGFGDPSSIEPLIKSHANIEAMDMIEGATPLIHAARTGHIDSMKALIKNGADLENTDRNGNTPLLACAKTSGGEAEKLKVLIEAGANIKAKDNRGFNALELARKRTDMRAPEIIAMLEPLLGTETPSADAKPADAHAGHNHD